LLAATIALDQDIKRLKPVDRSSPRAALQTFLESGDRFGEFEAREFLPSPSRSNFDPWNCGATRGIRAWA
jgi:hypothetical protein